MGVTSDTSSATSDTTTTHTRLKREDFRRTKHDSAFSQWKILIGAFDWEDHSMGKEGAEKYRTQNLPNWTSCPGVYELGIAASLPRSGRETRKLNSSSIVPVYLGQADNLRTRLQQYGRDGAHLQNGCSNNKIADCGSVSSLEGPGLFTDIFSRGFPIVYRCAPMKSKKDAEITEKQLLDKFDYAWNKGGNGARRQHDICKILDRPEKASQFSVLAKKFLFSNQREVGIKIRTGSNLSNTDNNTIFPRILGIRRLQPREEQYGSGDYCSDICGVSTGHGSICTTPPVAGRKRCAMHKGLRVNGYISKLDKEGKLPPMAATMDQHCSDFQDQKLSHSKVPPEKASQFSVLAKKFPFSDQREVGIKIRNGSNLSNMDSNTIFPRILGIRHLQPREEQYGSGDNCSDICGVSTGHGYICTTPPVAGRKRCAMHKGLRANGYISKLNKEGKVPPIAATMGQHCSYFQDQKLNHSRETHNPYEHGTEGKFTPTCGFILDDGSPCIKKPVQGNKRCLEHKGRRIHKSK